MYTLRYFWLLLTKGNGPAIQFLEAKRDRIKYKFYPSRVLADHYSDNLIHESAISVIQDYLVFGDPEHPLIYKLRWILASTYYDLREFDKAMDEWQWLVDLSKEISFPIAGAHIGLAQAQMALGKFGEAHNSLLVASGLEPGNDQVEKLLRECEECM